MLRKEKIVSAGAILLLAFILLPQWERMASAQDPELDAKTQQALVDAANAELKAFGGKSPIPGAVLGVWIPGKTPWQKGVGFQNISPAEPMQLDDKFRIGSNTKTFVVTVLLQLVDEGKLNLDDPLSKFDVGVKVPDAEKITVRELCQMRSGLFEAYNTPELDKLKITPQTKITPRELVGYAVKQPPLFAPGTKWNYCNTNYLLLGLIIEAVAHHPIELEIRNRLLVPLGLHNTSFPTSDPNMPLPFAHGYTLQKDGEWKDETVLLPPLLTWAAGVMISDMADMKIWVKDYVTGTTNGAATQKQRLDCLPIGKPGLSFGLGIGCSAGWYGYTGGIPGYNTGVYYFPGKDITIIALVNSQRETPDPGVANAIMRDFTKILTPENVAFPEK
jgi:D-alanyl-D-alanine carboxypeptidase